MNWGVQPFAAQIMRRTSASKPTYSPPSSWTNGSKGDTAIFTTPGGPPAGAGSAFPKAGAATNASAANSAARHPPVTLMRPMCKVLTHRLTFRRRAAHDFSGG